MNKKRRERYAERALMTRAKFAGRDDLLAASVQTKVGRKAMPVCAELFGSQKHFKQLADNTIKLMNETGGRHKHQVMHLLTAGLPKDFACDTLKMSSGERKRAYAALDLGIGRSLHECNYATEVTRVKINEGMDIIMDRFFTRTTHQCSGASNSKARIMDKDLHQWEALLHSNWPALLRELAMDRPDLVPDLDSIPKTGWTDFDASMLSAVHAEVPDAEAEQARRHKQFMLVLCNRLGVVRGCLPPKTPEEIAASKERWRARTASRLTKEKFDPLAYEIRAPLLKTFRKWLIKKGLRYTRFTVPHPCPLCNAGPTDEAVYIALNKQVEDLALQQKPISPDITARMTKLRKSLRIYRLHRIQLAHARAEAKETEDNLEPGTCMVIRDFVNHHDHAGKHVKCLN